jgi:YD repeat-containing protein
MQDGPTAVSNTFDNAGNLTLESRGGVQTGYTFDGENRMVLTVQPDGSRITMTYQGDGLRRSKQSGAKPVTTIWDGSDYLGEVNT